MIISNYILVSHFMHGRMLSMTKYERGELLKKEMKIAVTVFLIILAIVLTAGIIYFIYTDYGNTAGNEQTESSVDPDGEIQRLLETDKKIEFDETETAEGKPSEWKFSDDIHKMTHQKVKAQVKWGSLEITEERINNMLTTAEESVYQYKDFYIETLSAWQRGDFTNAVQVHNVIWKSQDGSIGIATGLLTEREEMEYKAQHFN